MQLPGPGHRSLLSQGVGYGLVGAVQLLLDWGTFVALTALGLAVVPANLIGRVGGAIVGYILNGAYTFAGTDGSRRLDRTRLFRFLAGWALMALVSTCLMSILEQWQGLKWAWFAKPAVDAGLAAVGFALSRYWIFK